MTCKHCKGIVHALLYCPEVALFWQKVRHFIHFNYNIDLTIDEKMLLTGYSIENENMIVLNALLIFAQCTTYRVYTFHVITN